MFSTCMFCKRSLGANEVVEEFPVGRRLAFDPDRGRLWVVCPRCERWNLSPTEERWEAIERCERIFRETRLRVSTENIGLARHLEGLELVRIGRPLRTEFAAWRYGDQFGRRRRKAIVLGVGGAAAIAALNIASPLVIGGSGLGAYWLWNLGSVASEVRARTRVRTDDGRLIKLRKKHYRTLRFAPPDDGEGFRLSLLDGEKQEWFDGAEAERLAGQIMPKINRNGGRKRTVRDAVREIEERGHPEAFLSDVVRNEGYSSWHRKGGYVAKMSAPTRLALEMALHEEEERRALEGELWRLERAWEEAEEIAAIADDLLIPRSVRERLQALKRKVIREGHRKN